MKSGKKRESEKKPDKKPSHDINSRRGHWDGLSNRWRRLLDGDDASPESEKKDTDKETR